MLLRRSTINTTKLIESLKRLNNAEDTKGQQIHTDTCFSSMQMNLIFDRYQESRKVFFTFIYETCYIGDS